MTLVIGNYLASTRAAAESSLSALNSSVNWLLTLSLALAAISINGLFLLPTGPHRELLVFLLLVVSIPVITHLGIRVAKSYINVVRFAAMERATLEYLVGSNASVEELVRAVKDLHVDWKTPIPRRSVVKKVFLELGIAYPALGIVAALVYLGPYAWSDNPIISAGAVVLAIVAAAAEIWIFSKSGYGRGVLVDRKAFSLR